jgi:hypothetical protein
MMEPAFAPRPAAIPFAPRKPCENIWNKRASRFEPCDPKQEPANARKAAAQRRAKQEREQKLEASLEQLEQIRQDRRYNRNEARASETDPEARVMKRNGGGFEPVTTFRSQPMRLPG